MRYICIVQSDEWRELMTGKLFPRQKSALEELIDMATAIA